MKKEQHNGLESSALHHACINKYYAHKEESPEIALIREDIFQDNPVAVARVCLLLEVILCFYLSEFGPNIWVVRR